MKIYVDLRLNKRYTFGEIEELFMAGKSMKLKVGVAVLSLTMMASTMSVFAASSFSNFSFSLPGFNGSKYTSYQTQVTTGATGEVENYTSGAKANVDARMIDKDGDAGAWTRNLNQGSSSYVLEGKSTLKAGDQVRAQFSSDISTTVAVDISGKWKSN